MTARLAGVIFDLDGTLAETHGMAVDLIGEAIVAGGGPELTPDEVLGQFGRNEQGIFQAVVGSGWETSWDYYLDAYVIRHQACSDPFPGIVDVLERLRLAERRVGLITAKTATTGRLSLEVLGIDHYFSDLAGGSSEGVIKQGQITELVEAWSCRPGQVAYVGDTTSDVVQAKAAGVVAAGACWSNYVGCDELATSDPDVLFTSVGEMDDWLTARIT